MIEMVDDMLLILKIGQYYRRATESAELSIDIHVSSQKYGECVAEISKSRFHGVTVCASGVETPAT